MKVLWCWRCRMDIPMLDEHEFEQVRRYSDEGPQGLIRTPEHEGSDSEAAFMTTGMKRLLDEYNRITGFGETNPSAVWHHRIALYGPPCGECGKPLRSPTASFCAACGAARTT